MISEGPGTIWESWTGGGSRSHPMFCGGVGIYLYTLSGIVMNELPSVETTLSEPLFEFKLPPQIVRNTLRTMTARSSNFYLSWAVHNNDTNLFVKIREHDVQAKSIIVVNFSIPYIRSTHNHAIAKLVFPRTPIIDLQSGLVISTQSKFAESNRFDRVDFADDQISIYPFGGNFSFMMSNT